MTDTNPLAQPMLARRMLRLAVMAALQPLKVSAGVTTISSPGVWPTPQEKLPALLVNTPTEQKSPFSTGQANFITGSSVVIQGQVSKSSPEEALDAIDALAFAVENAVLAPVLVAGTLRSAVLPLVPLDWSQARIVSADVTPPCQLAVGWK